MALSIEEIKNLITSAIPDATIEINTNLFINPYR